VKEGSTKTNFECKFIDPPTNHRCKKVTLDAGCKLTSQTSDLKCEKDTNNNQNGENDDCIWEDTNDKRYCKKYTKKCELYDEQNCGGFAGIKNNVQCVRLSTGCKEIKLHENCEAVSTYDKCQKREGQSFNEGKNKCYLNEEKTECLFAQKVCEELDSNKCTEYGGENCIKILNSSTNFLFCKLNVNVDAKCQIGGDGKCGNKEGAQIPEYQTCSFNEEYTSCGLVYTACESITTLAQCSNGIISREGATCSKVEGSASCKEVVITEGCKIDTDGKCQIQSKVNNNECRYNSEKTICQLYQVDTQCQLGEDLYCSLKDNKDTANLCYPNGDGTECKYRSKKCEDYSSDSTECEKVKSGNKKCSYVNYNECQEFTVDNYCTVEAGECKRASGTEDNDFNGYECIFDYLKSTCTRKESVCNNYYDSCTTRSVQTEGNKCISAEKTCKEITVEANCQVSGESCQNKDTTPYDKRCDFDDDKKSCKTFDKTCLEIEGTENCGQKAECVYLENIKNSFQTNKCYKHEASSGCKVENKECKLSDQSKADYTKCEYSYNSIDYSAECSISYLPCSNFDSDESKCKAAPRYGGRQCIYKSNQCKTIYIDNYCYVDSDLKCVEDGTGKLTQYEKCAFNSETNPTLCGKTTISCSDFTDSNCGNYKPETIQCFDLDKYSSYCKSVQIDSQCSINENNECVGSGCAFDEDNDKCFYTKPNNSELLKLKRFILLALVFMF
jgi:hypothetical protein